MKTWRDDDLDDGDDIETWMARRAGDVAKLNDPQSESLGRDAWATATRNGHDLSAPTPGDVRALGAQIACAPNLTVVADDFLPRAKAAGRGVVDAVAMGHGDEVEAGVRSIPTILSGGPIGSRFHQFLDEANSQDRYDQAHYPISRGTGELIGTGLALLGTDGAAGAMVPRLTTSTARTVSAMTGLERTNVALAGAGAGVAGQGLNDLLSGRLSDWRGYASSALGGATTAAAGGSLSPTYAAALGGAIASTANGLLNGQADLTGVEHAAVGAGYLGGAGRVAGERRSNSLHFRDKGKLGEALSDAKSFARGNPVVDTQVRQNLTNGRWTVLDSVLANGPEDAVESKFGPTASLSKNQRAYQGQNPGRLRVDYWMPSHVGQIAGRALSILGAPTIDWADSNRGAAGSW